MRVRMSCLLVLERAGWFEGILVEVVSDVIRVVRFRLWAVRADIRLDHHSGFGVELGCLGLREVSVCEAAWRSICRMTSWI